MSDSGGKKNIEDMCRKNNLCKPAVPINSTNKSKKMLQSESIRRVAQKFKPIRQGQPQNLTIQNVTQSCVTIQFGAVGTPKYYHVILTNQTDNSIKIHTAYTNNVTICNLDPDTIYEVNIIAFYDCNISYELDFRRTFRTEPTKTVQNIEIIHPTNTTFTINNTEVRNLIPINVKFQSPFVSPIRYQIETSDTNTLTIFDISHNSNTQLYNVPDVIISNTHNVTLFIRTFYDNGDIFEIQRIIGSFDEGWITGFQVIDTRITNIELSFNEIGSATTTFAFQEISIPISEPLNKYNLNVDTSYSITSETTYPSNNKYIVNDIGQLKTLNERNVQKVELISNSPIELTFIFEKPTPLFSTSSSNFYHGKLFFAGTLIKDISYNANIPDNDLSFNFYDLSANTNYTLVIENTYNSTGRVYTSQVSKRTLYEGSPVVSIINITGTSADISFTSFATLGDTRSTPDKYEIKYENIMDSVNYNINISSTETNLTIPISNQLLVDTCYNFIIVSEYATGNRYNSDEISIRTLQKGPSKSFGINDNYDNDRVNIKGDRIDVKWENFDYTGDLHNRTYIDPSNVNLYIITNTSTTVYDVSFNDMYYSIQSLIHNTNHKIKLEYVYSDVSYNREIEATTKNEFKFEYVTTDTGDTFKVRSDDTKGNNQQRYLLERIDEKASERSEWKLQNFRDLDKVSLNNNESKKYFYTHTNREGDSIFYCPDSKTIDLYRISQNDSTDSSIINSLFLYVDSITVTSNISSISSSYDGERIFVGYGNKNVDIFDISNLTFNQNPSFTIPSNVNVKSDYVLSNYDGNICAVYDFSVSQSYQNGVFFHNIDKSTDYFLSFQSPFTISSNSQRLRKDVTFDIYDNIAVAYDLITQNSNNPECIVRFYDISQNATTFEYIHKTAINDISGNGVSYVYDGSYAFIKNDYDISNGYSKGSVSVYDIQNDQFHPSKLYGENNTSTQVYPRNISSTINRDENKLVVAIGEYTYSYRTNANGILHNTKDGQIKIYELDISDNFLNNSFYQRGDVIKNREDALPLLVDDYTSKGHHFGYYMNLSKNGFSLMAASLPKISTLNFNFLGDVYVYRWISPQSKQNINAPFPPLELTKNVQFNQQIQITSYYNILEDDYEYVSDKITITTKEFPPIPNFVIYNNKIDINWGSVDYSSGGFNEYIIEKNGNIENSYNNINDISYSVTGLQPNQTVKITLKSVYRNNEIYIGFDDNITTLNEIAIIDNPIILNTNILTTLDISNQNSIDISENIIHITDLSNGTSYDIVVGTNTLVDISFINPDNSYKAVIDTYYITKPISYYNPPTNSISFTYDTGDNGNGFYQSEEFFFGNSRDISLNEDFQIINGIFQDDYESQVGNGIITRTSDDVNNLIYRLQLPSSTKKGTIQSWENSTSVNIVENKNVFNAIFSRYLDITNVEYHVAMINATTSNPITKLSQNLEYNLYRRYYELIYYVANLNNTTNNIEYKISLVKSDNSPIYETATFINEDISWNKASLKFFIEESNKSTIFNISRVGSEANQLYISNVQIEPYNNFNDTIAVFNQYENMWNTLKTNSSTTWKDTWIEEYSQYNTIRFASNMSISFWFYTHDNTIDTSGVSLFHIGGVNPQNYTTNSTVYIKCLKESISLNYKTNNNSIEVDSSFNHHTLNHAVFTIYDNTIQVFINGQFKDSIKTTTQSLISVSKDDIMYFGNEDSPRVIIQSFNIYDYKLENESILQLYTEELQSPFNKFDSLGNMFDFSDNIVSEFSGSTAIFQDIVLYLHGKSEDYTLNKTIYSQNKTITDISFESISFWLLNNEASFILDLSNSTIDICNNYLSQKDVSYNHVFLIKYPVQNKFKQYLNGFYYQDIYNNDIGTIDVVDISATNVGSIKLYDISFNDQQVYTLFYDYFKLYDQYDISGAYDIVLEIPFGSDISDVSYEITEIPDYLDSEKSNISSIKNGSFEFTGVIQNIITVSFDSFTLNKFNRSEEEITITLPETKTVYTMKSKGNPYIDISGDISEAIQTFTVNLVGDAVQDISFSYDLIGVPVVGYNDYTVDLPPGTINKNVDISFGDTIDYEQTTHITIHSLNLSDTFVIRPATFIDISANTTYLDIANKWDLSQNNNTFSIQFKTFDPDIYNRSDLSYTIDGVTSTEINGLLINDISFSNYNDPYYISDIFQYEMLTDAFNKELFIQTDFKTKINKNKRIILNDYYKITFHQYVEGDISNVIHNFESDITEIKEGESFYVKLKTPIYIDNQDSQHNYIYNISGTVSDDISGGDISGTFDIHGDSKIFYKKFTILYDVNIDDELFIMTIDLSNDSLTSTHSLPQTISESINVLNVNITDPNDPTNSIVKYEILNQNDIILSNIETDGFDEGDEFRIKIIAPTLSGKIVPYTIEDLFEQDISGILTGNIHIQDSSGTTEIFKLKEDEITDGQKRFKMKLGDYSSFIDIAINDTSVSLFYNLSFNKGQVNEGDDFTITLITNDNGNIDYIITGIDNSDMVNGIPLIGDMITDFSYNSGSPRTYTKTISIKSDTNTEGLDTFTFSLTGTRVTTNGIINLNNISRNITIIDTSVAPQYDIFFKIKDGNGGFVDNTGTTVLTAFTTQNNYQIKMDPINAPNDGTSVLFELDFGNTINPFITSSKLNHSSTKYTGSFITEFDETIDFTMNSVSDISQCTFKVINNDFTVNDSDIVNGANILYFQTS